MKKWLSVVLVLCMLMGMVPGVIAEEEILEIESVELFDEALEETEDVHEVDALIDRPYDGDIEQEEVANGAEEIEKEITDGELPAFAISDEVYSESYAEVEATNAGNVAINATNFPGTDFRNYIKNNFDQNGDGVLSQDEMEAVKEIDVSKLKDCGNLKGVSWFANLRTLNCNNCSLTQLDVSKNSLLEKLFCSSNKISSLNLNNNKRLIWLICDNNSLTSLDLRNNVELVWLFCNDNQLEKIDISGNKELKILYAQSNKLSYIDIKNCQNLKSILKEKQELSDETVYYHKENYTMQFDNSVTLTAGSAILYEHPLIAISPTYFPGADFRTYIRNYDENGDGWLSRSEIDALKKIEVYGDGEWGNLEGISYFTNLRELYCEDSGLTALDVSKNTKLTTLYCWGNKLKSLNVSKNTMLETLACCSNQLTKLDVSKNTKLATLIIWGNNIGTVNIGNCPKLVKLLQTSGYTDDYYSITWDDGEDDIHFMSIHLDTVLTSGNTILYQNDELTLNCDSILLGKKERFTLIPNLKGCTFSSSKTGVATVSNAGVVTGKGKGSAVITVTSPNGSNAACTVEVKSAPKKVTLKKKKVTLTAGQSYQLTATLPSGTASQITYKSSNSAVADVSENGYIYAKSMGAATITAKTFNGKKATCKVTVKHAKNAAIKYRALLIGECSFPGTDNKKLPGKKDVSVLKKTLQSVKGPYGNKWSIKTATNRTADQIHSDIKSAFAGATEEDVSLFYISTHGAMDYYDASGKLKKYKTTEYYESAGCLSTYPASDGRAYLTLPTLASWLNEVPGQVIVMIDSCGSGVAIYQANGKKATIDVGDFNQLVVDAFSSKDGGVVVSNGFRDGAFVQRNKFYVLTSTTAGEYGWSGDYSYFVKWINNAVKTKGKMPADSNKNKYLTLNELYKYVYKKGKKATIKDEKGKKHKQYCQVYPANSNFELFYR